MKLDHVRIADGCLIDKAALYGSLIGNRSVIGRDVIIRNSVMMGSSYYESENEQHSSEVPAIGIGQGSYIEGAIIDRNVRVGPGVRIEPFPPDTCIDEEDWIVRDGIVVIPHHSVISEGTVIAP